MRNTKLLAMILTFCIALTFLGGCSGGASAPTTEEPTTTTTAAPTPTPEPTPTPTPTPPVEKWATDEKLIRTWFCYDNLNILNTYSFHDDNTGLIVTMMTVEDGKTKEKRVDTYVIEFKYSVISEGMIRMFKAPSAKGEGMVTGYDDSNFLDVKYKFVGQSLQLEFLHEYSSDVKIFTKEMYRIYPF